MSEWISVKDKLPGVNDWPIAVAEISEDIEQVNAVFCFGFGNHELPEWVTHWTPLPPPPKK